MKKIILFSILLISDYCINAQNAEAINDSIQGKPFVINVSQENRKLIAKFLNKSDTTKKYTFFTNYITFDEFVKNFTIGVSTSLGLDTSLENVKNEIKLKSIKFYKKVPTESISANDSINASVTLRVNKFVPVYNSIGERLQEDPYEYLVNLIRKTERIRQEIINSNMDSFEFKQKIDFEIVEKSDVKRIKIPAKFGTDSLITPNYGQSIYKFKDLSYKPQASILNLVEYKELITACEIKEVKFDTVDIRKITNTPTINTIKGEITIKINREKIDYLKKLAQTDFESYVKFENYKSHNRDTWKITSKILNNRILELDEDDFSLLRDQINYAFIDIKDDSLLVSAKNISSLQLLFDAVRKNHDSIQTLLAFKNYRKLEKFKQYNKLKTIFCNFIFKDLKNSTTNLNIEKIKFVIKNGLVEHIKITGYLNGEYSILENKIPFAISSKANLNRIKHQWLISFNNQDIKIKLQDVFIIDNNIDLNTKDFSPDDLVKEFVIDNDLQNIYLTRDPQKEIIDVKMFTDIIGIDSKTPNGLVQLELSHSFKLWTTKRQFKGYTVFGGFLEYLKIYGQLSKIENKERYLPIKSDNYLINGSLYSRKYAPTIDFYRYQTLQVGIILNAGMIGFDNLKSRIYFDMGMQYFSTGYFNTSYKLNGNQYLNIQDTSKNFVGNFLMYPELRLQVIETNKIGLEGGIRWNCMFILNHDLNYSNSENYEKRTQGTFKTYFGEFFYKPVDKSKLYGRLSFNVQNTIYKNHFYQIQIGYNTSIYKNLK